MLVRKTKCRVLRQINRPTRRFQFFKSADELLKCEKQCHWAVLFRYKVVGTFESVDEILKYDHSNESYWAVLSCGTVYYAVYGGSSNNDKKNDPCLISKSCHHATTPFSRSWIVSISAIVLFVCFCSFATIWTGDKLVKTLSLNGVTSENKTIHTPPLSPPSKAEMFVVFYR